MRLLKSEERVYKIPYREGQQVVEIEKKLTDLSGIYSPPTRVSGIGATEDGFAHVGISHVWTTSKPPYINISYNPFKDGPEVVIVRSNVVTPEMVEKVQEALGLRRTA